MQSWNRKGEMKKMSIEEKELSKELKKSQKHAKKISDSIDTLEALKTGNLSDLDIIALNHVIGLLIGVKSQSGEIIGLMGY